MEMYQGYIKESNNVQGLMYGSGVHCQTMISFFFFYVQFPEVEVPTSLEKKIIEIEDGI